MPGPAEETQGAQQKSAWQHGKHSSMHRRTNPTANQCHPDSCPLQVLRHPGTPCGRARLHIELDQDLATQVGYTSVASSGTAAAQQVPQGWPSTPPPAAYSAAQLPAGPDLASKRLDSALAWQPEVSCATPCTLR